MNSARFAEPGRRVVVDGRAGMVIKDYQFAGLSIFVSATVSTIRVPWSEVDDRVSLV